MQRAAWFLVSTTLTGLLLACGQSEPAPSPSGAPASTSAPAAAPAAPAAASASAAEEAGKIYAMRCVTCHGLSGAGDGPGSAALNPKPRDFRDAAWQASVTDDHISKIVQFGGAAVGKSPAMPGNPDLMSKPDVLQALVAEVRGKSAPQ